MIPSLLCFKEANSRCTLAGMRFSRPGVVSVILIVFCIVGYGIWLLRYEEVVVVDILASREADLGLPVYAQFVVTQTVTVPEIASLTRLSIPMFFSGAETLSSYEVAVFRNDTLLQRWQRDVPKLPLGDSLVQDVLFDLDPPRLVDGVLSVRIAAPGIVAAERNRAPRVFVEPDDTAYLGGNYRIAANEKQGDVSLQLVGRERRGVHVVEQLRRQPLAAISFYGGFVFILILVGALPFVFVRGEEHTMSHTTGRIEQPLPR